MKQRLLIRWQRVPHHIRRPVVLTVGMFFVLLAGSIGWLPGPGGIPVFLLGIAILSSEYHWANRFKLFILSSVKLSGAWIRSHRSVSALILCSILTIEAIILYMLFHFK